MVGQNASDALFDTLEETGGSKDSAVVSHTHTFSGTTSENGSHNHTTNVDRFINYTADDFTGNNTFTQNFGNPAALASSTAGLHAHTVSGTTGSTGSSGTNANLPPYITVKMWKRTA
jgi:hypothetical protein